MLFYLGVVEETHSENHADRDFHDLNARFDDGHGDFRVHGVHHDGNLDDELLG